MQVLAVFFVSERQNITSAGRNQGDVPLMSAICFGYLSVILRLSFGYPSVWSADMTVI